MEGKSSQSYFIIITFFSILILFYTYLTPPCFSQDVPDLDAKVRNFALHEYNGIPYDEARQFDARAIPILEELLNDPANEKYYATIVQTLGIIGDEKGLDILIQYFERRTKSGASKAIFIVNIAIGHIAANGSRRAMDYLIAGINPETWQKKGLKWSHDNAIQSAIYGLAITGSDEAERALKDLQKRINNTEIYEKIKSALNAGLVTNARVRENGGYAEYEKNISKYSTDTIP